MKRFLFLMLLAAGFAACSDEEETLGGKDIQFAEGTSDKIGDGGDGRRGNFVHDDGTLAGYGDAGDESRRRGLAVCGHEGGGRDELGGCGA